MTPEQFREGIFNLSTRRFGTLAEVMTRKLVSMRRSVNLFQDIQYDLKNHRVEMKFSTVRRKSDRSITEATILDCIQDELSENRHVKYAEWERFAFECKIQQVEPARFDVLYYGLFFRELVLIFRIESNKIGDQIFYTEKQDQGVAGAGWFHLNPTTLPIHIKNFLYKKISYDELLSLLT